MPFDSVLPFGAATLPADPAPARVGLSLVAERVAASLLHAPHARLCLLDAAASALGDADGQPPCEQGDAMLAAAVAARGAPLLVADADAEPDAALAAALRALGCRAYLGVPVVAADGAILGVLAVADARPRDWQPGDVGRLADAALLAAEACAERGDGGDAARWLRRIARREARAARRTSERRLALIFNGTADLTFLVSVDGAVLRCAAANDAFLAAVGCDATHVVGRPLDAMLPAPAAASVVARCDAALRGGLPVRYEQRLALAAGARTLDLTLTPILDDAPRCAYVLGVARDVSATD